MGAYGLVVRGALSFLKQGKLSAFRTNHGLPGRDITTMSEDHRGRLWIGVDSSLAVLDHGHFLPIPKPDGSSLGIVLGIAEDAAGNEWAMTSGKLFRIENLKVRKEISLSQKCFSIAGDSKEGVWLGCVNGDLAHYYSDRSDTFPRVSATYIRQVLPDPSGGLWAVTDDALIWWNNNSSATMTTQNGLPCDESFAVVKDEAGTLWIYARCGLLSIAAPELVRWHQNPSIQVKVEALDVYDGAQPGITPLRPQAIRSLDGRLWFANDNLVQTFDPRKWPRNTLPPNVVVERFAAKDVSYPIQHGLKLPALIRNLEIDYTALSFVVPQKVRFRYKLEGKDTSWQEAGVRRQAFYTDLAPGSYRFRVIACNNDSYGTKTEQRSISLSLLLGIRLDGSARRAWLHFFSCCGPSINSVFFNCAGSSRSGWMRVSMSAHVSRANCTTPLLQTLHGLMFQFQAVRNLLPRRTEEAIQSLDDAITDTEKALAESRDAIQGLRSEAMAKGNLAEILVAKSRELAQSGSETRQPPAFDLIEEGERRILAPDINDELARITLEILRNAFRHAQATRIEAEIRYDHQELRVRDS